MNEQSIVESSGWFYRLIDENEDIPGFVKRPWIITALKYRFDCNGHCVASYQETSEFIGQKTVREWLISSLYWLRRRIREKNSDDKALRTLDNMHSSYPRRCMKRGQG